MNDPRVLVVTTNLAGPQPSPTAAAGNTWRLVFTEIGRHLEGTILAPRDGTSPDRESIGGLQVRRVAPRRPTSSLADAVRGPDVVRVAAGSAALWRATRRAIEHGSHDVVHALWAFPAGLAATMPRSPVPVLLSCPGSDIDEFRDRTVAGRVIRRALRSADVVAPMSTRGIDRAFEVGARSVHSVPVCFDPQSFPFSDIVVDEPVVTYAGRLTRSKGVFVLADALKILNEQIPGLRFVCCGSGPDAGAFEERLRWMGRRATFHGAVAPTAVGQILASSRVAVLPSFGEGMSAAALETLAVGRPLVCTDVGEHTELVRDGGGAVVPTGDAAALASAIAGELARTRDPRHIRSLAEPFTPARVASRLRELYAFTAVSRRRMVAGWRPLAPRSPDLDEVRSA